MRSCVAPNVWILLALHLPTLVAVAIIDSAVSSDIERARRRHADCLVPVHGRLLRRLRHRQLSRDRRRRRGAAGSPALSSDSDWPSGSRFRWAARDSTTSRRSLQPHFLFNSLGAVSELAYDAPGDREPRPAAAHRDLSNGARPEERRSHAGRRDRRDRAVSRHSANSIRRLADDRLPSRRCGGRLSAAAFHSAAARRERHPARPERTKRGGTDRDLGDGRSGNAHRSRVGQRRRARRGTAVDAAAASASPTCATVWRSVRRRRSPAPREQRQRAARSPSSRFPFVAEIRT